MREAPERHARSVRIALLATLVVLSAAKSALWATTHTVLMPSDEVQHVDYVARLVEERRIPVTGQDTIRAELWRLVRASVWFNDRYPANGDPAGRDRLPLEREAWRRAFASDEMPGIAQESYEGQQPPVAYALLTPGYLLGRGSAAGAVTALRLWNGVLSALVVVLVYHLSLFVLPGRPPAALLTAGISGALQIFNAAAATVSNDALTAVAAIGALLVIARTASGVGTATRWLGAGLAAGIAVLVKFTVLFVAPALVIGLVLGMLHSRQRSARRAIHLAAATACGFLVVTAPWLMFMTGRYGSVTGESGKALVFDRGEIETTGSVAGAVISAARWQGLLPRNFIASLRGLRTDMWSAHFMAIDKPTPYDRICWLLVVAGLALALLAGLRRNRDSTRVLAVFAYVLLAFVVQTITLGGLTGKRAISFAPLIVLATVGGFATIGYRRPRLRHIVALVAIAALASADLLTMLHNLNVFYLGTGS